MRRDKKTRRGTATPTLIAKGTCIVGEIHFSGSLEIEGQVKGNIEAASDDVDACVRIHDTGVVMGQVKAPLVVVSGSIEGDIYAAKQVELASHAVVKGDIHYALLEIEKGAQVNGGFVQQEESVATAVPKVEKAEVTSHREAIGDTGMGQA
ncbi:MAG: polymer-forming cytoskeletal protein [Gammaproteobacteria bacterium]|nr:polymer-forming cytoskeletal protein [Gammaproteobacteria bacterium]MBQ0840952.1 polymer-forming cytoskeletal protein [Gammaproteobacteria bacterium]